MDPLSFANLSNLKELESLEEKYLKDPLSVDPSLRYFFQGMEFAHGMPKEAPSALSDDLKVHLLIEAYRTYGHEKVSCNPIATKPMAEPEMLKLDKLHFSEKELSALFPTCGFLEESQAPLAKIIEKLEKTYCGNIGFEYKGLGNPSLEAFVEKEVEFSFGRLTREEKIEILKGLTQAEVFETFLHTKYVGQKRFSLEGGETLIPLMIQVISSLKQAGNESAIIGMAHRGRLNVLVNLLGKSYSEVFFEFEGHYTPGDLEGSGDVKYHKGFEGALQTPFGKIDVILAPNPSHLESVDPVVEGMARAYQELGKKAAPLLIHGDASVAGQGVVYETLQMGQLNGYSTQGTIHIVVNNQIGFTTLPKDGRSTRYPTDIAKAFNAPVFHVNAEDPLSCVAIAALAVKIREKFGSDVFIDLNCYRKYGHNESDEPAFTQPLEYALIQKKKTIRELYAHKLIQEQLLSSEEASRMEEDFKEKLKKAFETPFVKQPILSTAHHYQPLSTMKTGVGREKIATLADLMTQVPSEMRIHPKLSKLLSSRKEALCGADQQKRIDWGTAEMIAYASLVDEKVPVRISGQDVRRGTFSHRQAFLVDQIKEKRYCPLSHLPGAAGLFEIYNSPLSEFAVLGFEFGYSNVKLKGLNVWEAQFGDFANGAQVIIDQYLASSEQKWDLSSNLCLFLPHGYEGQGPEHSSARIERFLQLASQNNMRILNATTPAQLFHLIRAQALLDDKRPLVLFSPKAILRNPECLSAVDALTQGHFEEVLEEENPNKEATCALLCSGKIFYDLLAEKKKNGKTDYALIRLEQLYPFPEKALKSLLESYTKAKKFAFVQEEHANMGAFSYLKAPLEALLQTQVQYIGREESAATAVGSYALHQKQHATLLKEAYTYGN